MPSLRLPGPYKPADVRAAALRVAGIVATYYVAALLGLAVSLQPSTVSPLWPPAGVALAGLWLFGLRYWPAVAVAQILVSTHLGLPWPGIGLMAAVTTLEAVIPALVLRRAKVAPGFHTIAGVFTFTASVVLAGAPVGAALGLAVLCLSGVAPWGDYPNLWAVWWQADAAGAVVVTPVLVCWLRLGRAALGRAATLAAAPLAAVAAVAAVVFGLGPLHGMGLNLIYAVFPPLVWAVMRAGQAGAAGASFVVASLAVLGTVAGRGPALVGNAPENLAFLQTYLGVVVVTALILAAALSERDRGVARARHSSDRAEAAQREAQRWLQEICDATPTVIFLKDLDGRYLQINRRCEELFGVCRADFVGRTDFDLFPQALAERLRANDRAVVAAGQPVQFEEIVPDAGGDRTYMSVKFPILGGDGAACGVCGIATDITARKAVECALVDAKEAAEAADRTKTEFLANMSHELRTPLNAVLGFSEVMYAEMFGPLGGERYRDYALSIHQSGQHLLELINDILDVSKIQAGRMSLNEAPVILAQAVESTLRLMRGRAEEAGIRLTATLAAALPPVLADCLRLRQILLNLLSNAVKFTPAGGAVTLAACCAADGDLVVSVQDTGIGIAPEDLATVMVPFGQVDSRLSRRYQGSGLGLPLAKAFVEMHGGTLTLDSRVGHGTTVTIRLPAWRLAPAPAPAPAPPPTPAPVV